MRFSDVCQSLVVLPGPYRGLRALKYSAVTQQSVTLQGLDCTNVSLTHGDGAVPAPPPERWGRNSPRGLTIWYPPQLSMSTFCQPHTSWLRQGNAINCK